MDVFSVFYEQSVVYRLLGKRMLEGILPVRMDACGSHQVQLFQSLKQLIGGFECSDPFQHAERKGLSYN